MAKKNEAFGEPMRKVETREYHFSLKPVSDLIDDVANHNDDHSASSLLGKALARGMMEKAGSGELTLKGAGEEVPALMLA